MTLYLIKGIWRTGHSLPNETHLYQQYYFSEVVMGPGQKFLTQIGSGQLFVARVGSGQPFMVWVRIWKISPKNVFFPSDQKKSFRVGSESTRVEAGSASYLLRVKSKLGSGQVRAHLHSEGSLLLDQK